MDKNILYYHGTGTIVQKPDLKRSRKHVDFGRGFYLTTDLDLAAKWACRKKEGSVVNQYNLNFNGLKVKNLNLDKEWLHYVAGNRTGHPQDYELFFDDKEYDVIIGPIADDNLFTTLDLYLDGFISATKAVKIMDCMEFGNQIVLKTPTALKQLDFFTAKPLSDKEKIKYQKLYERDKVLKMEKTATMMRSIPDVWRD